MQHFPAVFFVIHVSSKQSFNFHSCIFNFFVYKVLSKLFSFIIETVTPTYGQEHGDIPSAVAAPILITVFVIIVVVLFIGRKRL